MRPERGVARVNCTSPKTKIGEEGGVNYLRCIPSQRMVICFFWEVATFLGNAVRRTATTGPAIVVNLGGQRWMGRHVIQDRKAAVGWVERSDTQLQC